LRRHDSIFFGFECQYPKNSSKFLLFSTNKRSRFLSHCVITLAMSAIGVAIVWGCHLSINHQAWGFGFTNAHAQYTATNVKSKLPSQYLC
jgi:hypothetical protein